jgi:Tubulin/FtsZ family, GTPase domain
MSCRKSLCCGGVANSLLAYQVINSIQTGPYKNIYNPENFFVGKNGVGAANNWGDGYQTGESVHEDIMEMIDREADGSDSLEVCFHVFPTRNWER